MEERGLGFRRVTGADGHQSVVFQQEVMSAQLLHSVQIDEKAFVTAIKAHVQTLGEGI